MNTELFLTFAEAMALDPSEVEVQCQEEHCWSPLSARYAMTLAHARTLRFRRARPKRSRVQEMCEAEYASSIRRDFAVDDRMAAIRAVCEWLREGCVNDFAPHARAARAIEHEFLEPR